MIKIRRKKLFEEGEANAATPQATTAPQQPAPAPAAQPAATAPATPQPTAQPTTAPAQPQAAATTPAQP